MADYLLGVPKRTVAPTTWPVTREEVQDELGIWDTALHIRLDRLIRQATEQVESDARRVLMTQTWQLWLDRFPCHEIALRKFPVQSVTHLKYYTSGVLTTWASSNYQTDLITEPCRIEPVQGTSWPVPDYDKLNAVQVEWIAGYASQALVPNTAKSAVLYAVKQMFYGCEMSANYWAMIERIRSTGFIV